MGGGSPCSGLVAIITALPLPNALEVGPRGSVLGVPDRSLPEAID
jgi:hypothetical protein